LEYIYLDERCGPAETPTIWREHNARIFDSKEKSLSRLVTEIRDEARLWVQTGAKGLSLLPHAPRPVITSCKLYFFSPELSE
jgi:hypothetical protein